MIIGLIRFKFLFKVLNLSYGRASQNTIRNDYINVYDIKKDKLKTCLKDLYMILLTSNCWTSNQKVEYICLILYYIDKSWKY